MDLLQGRLDNMEALTSLVRSVDRRLMGLEAMICFGSDDPTTRPPDVVAQGVTLTSI